MRIHLMIEITRILRQRLYTLYPFRQIHVSAQRRMPQHGRYSSAGPDIAPFSDSSFAGASGSRRWESGSDPRSQNAINWSDAFSQTPLFPFFQVCFPFRRRMTYPPGNDSIDNQTYLPPPFILSLLYRFKQRAYTGNHHTGESYLISTAPSGTGTFLTISISFSRASFFSSSVASSLLRIS